MDFKVKAVFVWVSFVPELRATKWHFDDLHLFHECKGGVA